MCVCVCVCMCVCVCVCVCVCHYPALDTQALTTRKVIVSMMPCVHTYKVKNTAHYYHHDTHYITTYAAII